MGLALSSYYQWLNPFNSNLTRKREREEEVERGSGMFTYFRRRKRVSKRVEILTYFRRRKRESNKEGGGCEREKEKEIVHENSNKRVRDEGGTVSVQGERALKKERTVALCSSPRISFLTPHSSFNWFSSILICF